MLYNYFDNFHILGTLPVHGYTENKVNVKVNEVNLTTGLHFLT